ncbi:MAG: glycosyltransferase [Planctomycetota bacterium]|jgi:glycosyltransferase involved in cell wall biosynthesis
MTENYEKKAGPLVTVLLPTFNRPRCLPVALSSIVRQDYSNLEIFVINDGGVDVSNIVNSFDDPRIIFINRKENRGLPFTLNEAIVRAKGKYVCYLGDDDLYYPHHVSTLLNILETQDQCQVAYSDLYKTYCRVFPDGSRQPLSKVVEVSRDFDRFFMFYFNHVLNVGMMHRRDSFEKTGLYNEDLNILIDWDMTRRLVFFTDFYHTCEVTGEFYSPVGESDRISVQGRKDKNEYQRNVLAIRTTRPPKPWPKVKDLSIIFTSDRLGRQAGKNLGLIWRFTFYPYKLYLPLMGADLNRLNTDMPNIVLVPVGPFSSQAEQIDTALQKCEGEYIAIVPGGFPIEEMWVEDSLYALINSRVSQEGFLLEGSTDTFWAAVVRKSDLQFARKSFPNLPVRQSLEAAGILLRTPKYEEMPFLFDDLLRVAQLAQKDGNWAKAAQMFGYIADRYQNELWMRTLAANAFYKAGDHIRALKLSSEVNRLRPTVNALLLEAKVNREKKNFSSAIGLLERAEQILEGRELLWT